MFIQSIFRSAVGALLLTVLLAGGGSAIASQSFGATPVEATLRQADFAGDAISAEVKRLANWVVRSRDNMNLPFVIVDKVNARLFLFDCDGIVVATAPVLLGLARGDDSPPGIGTRPLSSIKPAERITPAGRFVLEAGENMAGKSIIWVDYDAAISLHRASDRKPVLTAKSRVERLASASVADRRISLGCINVSTAFYDAFIQPSFAHTNGIAYVMPETRSTSVQFNIPDEAPKGFSAAEI